MSAPETRLVRPKAREPPILQLAHAALVVLGCGVGAGMLYLLVGAEVIGGGEDLDRRGLGAGGGHCVDWGAGMAVRLVWSCE
jgi:hypothetical protein